MSLRFDGEKSSKVKKKAVGENKNSNVAQGRRIMASDTARCGEKDEFDFSLDPLDFKIPDSVLPATQTRIPRDFTITTDSYISLCSRVYATCCMDDSFATIPESAFQYLAIIHLWKRLAKILPSSAKDGSKFFTELDKLSMNYTFIPKPLQTYLNGIGYFRDPDGCDRRFVLPGFPTSEKIAGIPYTFGRVNAKTHFFYEAFPAPGIAALRMQADLRYTENPCEENLIWDLPEGLRPDIQESHVESVKPTRNLLGWAPAQRLNVGQLKFMNLLKMDEDFMKNNYSFANQNLRSLVHQIGLYFITIRQSIDDPRVASCKDSPLTGSLVQGITIEKRNEFAKFDRSAMYCEGNLSVCSPYKSKQTLNKGAVIAGYRLAKELVCDRHCWSCYDFDEYKHVPESWIRSRNTVYTYGRVGRLNEIIHTTGYMFKKVLQNECIQSTMMPCGKLWNTLQ